MFGAAAQARVTVRWFADDAEYHVSAIEMRSRDTAPFVRHLANFPRLRHVRIPYASEAETEQLQSLLPSCIVQRRSIQ